MGLWHRRCFHFDPQLLNYRSRRDSRQRPGYGVVGWFCSQEEQQLVFLLLSILLFLVGGGVAQIVFFTLAWAVSTRINKPVTWLRVVFPESVRGVLAKLWFWLLIAFTLLALIALEIAIVGYVPRVSDPRVTLHICWFILGVDLGILFVAFLSGFAHDLDRDRLAG